MSSANLTDIVNLSVESHCELSAIETQNNIIIISIYRTPDSDINIFFNTLHQVFLLSKIQKNKVILLGDFNVKFNTNDKDQTNLCDYFKSYNFTQVISEPTRKNNCIDNIFINFEETYESFIFDTTFSDHKAIAISFKISKPNCLKKESQLPYRSITESNLIKFHDLLNIVSWNFIDNNSTDINALWNEFIGKFTYNINIAFPLKYKKTGSSNVKRYWNNPLIQNKRRTLNLIQEWYIAFPTKENKELLQQHQKAYKSEINKVKQMENDKIIKNSGNKPKAFWRLINKRRGKTNSKTTNNISAEQFNNYFANIAKKVISNLPLVNINPLEYVNNEHQENNYSIPEFTYNEVRDAINYIKNKSSKDVYDINIKIIKSVIHIITIPLTKLFNLSLKLSIFPEILKLSKVIPIHKTGCLDDMNNYRPISLIPIFGKIFEVLINNRLGNYFESNNIFSNSQYGFRKKHSTTQAINSICEQILQGFENLKFTGCKLYDLTKAFDCISHPILLQKLKRYGISNTTIAFIHSYLSNRKQITFYNNSLSTQILLEYGVPQGSILGPLLFLIYINDLPNCCFDSTFVLFADDTTTLTQHSNISDLETSLSQVHSKIDEWFLSNCLSVNNNKTETIIFSLREHDITTKPSVKFLGVFLDTTLTWQDHVNFISNKLSSSVFLLRNLMHITSLEVGLTAYFSVFQSTAQYGILAWGHSAHLARVFGIQRRAIRAMLGLDFRADVSNKFKDLNILTIPCLFIYECIKYIHLNKHSFSSHSDNHNYNTRYNKNLITKFSRLSKSQNSLNFYCVKFYNKIPAHIKNDKNCLLLTKNYLLQNAFYSLDEFLQYFWS